jgi:hypothetical protein
MHHLRSEQHLYDVYINEMRSIGLVHTLDYRDDKIDIQAEIHERALALVTRAIYTVHTISLYVYTLKTWGLWGNRNPSPRKPCLMYSGDYKFTNYSPTTFTDKGGCTYNTITMHWQKV